MALETDPHRLEQRQKQIDFGLATTGYANYVAWLKSNKGKVKPIPIPNIYIKCSKRSWDGQIRLWRRLLHLWDAVEPPTGAAHDRNFQDPCEGEAFEYTDVELETLPEPKAMPGKLPFNHPHPGAVMQQRVASPTQLSTVPSRSVSPDMDTPDSPHRLHPSAPDECASVFSPHLGQQPNPHVTPPQHQPHHHHHHHHHHHQQHHHQQHQHHQVLHSLQPQQQQFPQMHQQQHLIPQLVHPQMQFQAPQGFPAQYGFPALPGPGWQFSLVPPGFSAFTQLIPPQEDCFQAEMQRIVQKERDAREELQREQAAEQSTFLFQQYRCVLQSFSAVQDELEMLRKSVRMLSQDRLESYGRETARMYSSETTMGFQNLLSEELAGRTHCDGELEGLLPPSLSDVSTGLNNPSPTDSGSVCAKGFTSLAQLDGSTEQDRSRYIGELLRRRDSPSIACSLPQAGSPMSQMALHFTPRRNLTPQSSSSSPGITPSPSDRLNPHMLSPMALSPCGAPLFTETSPQQSSKPTEQGHALGDSKGHPWPGTPVAPPRPHESLFYSPSAVGNPSTKQQASAGSNLHHYFRTASNTPPNLSVPPGHPFTRTSTSTPPMSPPPVSPSASTMSEVDAEAKLEMEMSQSLSDTLATLAEETT